MLNRWWKSPVIDGALILALFFLFFWRDFTPVPSDRRSFAAGDFTEAFYAPTAYGASRWHQAELPLWNPHVYAGHPHLADIQNAVFYPPRTFTTLLAMSSGFSIRAIELEALAHYLLVLIGTYLLARRLSGSRIGGIVASLAFTFGGYLTGYPPLQLAILETFAWLPWILLCLIRAGEMIQQGTISRALRWCVGGGILLGISWLAGHPQSALLLTCGSLAYGLFRFWPQPDSIGARRWTVLLAPLLLFLLVGAGLSAIHTLPGIEYLRLSTRAEMSFDIAGRGFLPYDMFQVLFPAIGVPFTALYYGIITLGLVAAALLAYGISSYASDRVRSTVRRRDVTFWGASGLIALLLSFGKLTPVYWIFYILVPGWSMFRHQERSVAWLAMAVALLAGYGAAWLSRESREKVGGTAALPSPAISPRLTRWYAWGTGGALAVAVVFFVGYQTGFDALWGFTSSAIFLCLLFGLSAIAFRSRLPLLWVAVLAFDLFTVNAGRHYGPAEQQPFPYQTLLTAPAADSSIFRLANEDVLPANYGNIYELEDIGGASPLQLAALAELKHNVTVPMVWQLLNVKYVVTWREYLDVPAERLAEDIADDGKPVYTYRLESTGEAAWLAGELIFAPESENVWQHLSSVEFDPLNQAVIPHSADASIEDNACRDGRISWQRREAERLELVVESASRCLLVLSELDYPGWQASLNGRSTEILRANGALRAVMVDAGTTHIEFVFRPTSVLIGGLLSVITLTVAMAYMVFVRGESISRGETSAGKVG